METQAFSKYFWFRHLTDERDNEIQNQQPKAEIKVLLQKHNDAPRNEDGSHADDGQKVGKGDEKGEKKSIFHTQDPKADEQKRKG